MKRPFSQGATSISSTEQHQQILSVSEGNGFLPQHNPYCSAFAGALRTGGNAVLGSEGIEAMKHTLESSLKKGTVPFKKTSTTSTTTKAVASATSSSIVARAARVAVPGGLAFETHHAAAKGLLDSRHRTTANDSTTKTNTNSSLGSLASHTLHFVAGGAGGLSFGLAATLLQWQVPTGAFLVQQVLSHGALFGGFDCFMDIVPSLVKRVFSLSLSEENDSDKIQEYVSVGLSGGCAGVTQQLVGRHLLSSGKSFSLRSTVLAFPPSALAFLAYHYTAEILGSGGGGHH